MKKLFTFFTLAIMGFVAAFAAEEATETATATIIVQGPGEPYEEPRIEGAFVFFMDKEYFTPANGELRIEGINPDDVLGEAIDFSVFKEGYKLYEGTVDFTEGLEGSAIVTLTPEIVTLTIKVTDPDYEPIAEAQVYFNDETYVTDETGSVTIEDLYGPDVMFKKDLFYSIYKDGYVPFDGNAFIETAPEALISAIIEADEATLTVKVVTGEENDPIEGAIVTFQGKEVLTNENGHATFTGISAPEVLLQEVPYTVYKDGYDFYEGLAMFDMLEAQAIANLKPAEVTLTIKVTDSYSEPIEGATVTFEEETLTTNASGEVVIEGLSGPDVLGKDIPFTVYKDGYAQFEGVATIEVLEAMVAVELIALEEATLTVKVVTGEENDPIEGATVTFKGKEYITNENGEVKFTGISAPSVIGKMIPYTVYIDGYDFYEGVADFSETMEAYEIASLVPAKASLSIKVMAEGEPVEGATVTFQGKEYTSNENGEVKIEGINGPDVMGKTIPFTVYIDGYNVYKGEAEFIETLEVSLVAELVPFDASITVKVMAGEDPVEEAMVTFDGNDYITDANGEVVITGIHGPSVIGKTLPITVYKDGYETFEGEVDFTETLEAYVIAELEVAEATVTVKVMDGEDPVEGATVTFEGKEYTTDANGEVKITGIDGTAVIGKTLPITVSKDGYETYEGVADFSETLEAYVVVELVNIQTGINAIFNDIDNSDVKVYDLNGRRVINPQNGQVYIVNGIKVLLNR